MHLNLLTLYFITVSLTGLVLLAVLVFISSPSNATIPWQKTFVYLIFILICFLGIMAGIFPSKCLKMIRSQKTVQSNGLNQEEIEEIGGKARTGNTGVKSREIEGHHPDCGNFSAHVFKLGDKTYCAGCTGLILGAMISIFSAVIYVLEGWFLGKMVSSSFGWVLWEFQWAYFIVASLISAGVLPDFFQHVFCSGSILYFGWYRNNKWQPFY